MPPPHMQRKEFVRLPAIETKAQCHSTEDDFVTEYELMSIQTSRAPEFIDLTMTVRRFCPTVTNRVWNCECAGAPHDHRTVNQ